MGLNFPGEWKFEGIGIEIPPVAVNTFIDLIIKIADGSKQVVEQFKAAFGVHVTSSSYDWAESDLRSAVQGQSSNAAVFIDSLWKGIVWAEAASCIVPSAEHVNKLLSNTGIPFRVEPPNLVLTSSDSMLCDVTSDGESTSQDSEVPNYVLGERLGAGGYGVVYKAVRATSVGQFDFAVKVLDPSPFVEDFEKAVKRFRKEIEILKCLQHRAIVPYFDAGISKNGKPFVVMPLIQGTNLCEVCQSRNFKFTILCFMEILRALEYAHKTNVIHRDLKPSNILVRTADDQPIILDFGSAYALDQMDIKTLTTQAVGTIGYIPSEVLMNPKRRSALHDIFSCGVMLYESLGVCRPDPANYKPLADMRSDCKGIDSVIRHAIAGEDKRTGSAGEFVRELTDLI